MTAKFKEVKLGIEIIEVDAQKTESIHIKVSIPGLMEAFFSADY